MELILAEFGTLRFKNSATNCDSTCNVLLDPMRDMNTAGISLAGKWPRQFQITLAREAATPLRIESKVTRPLQMYVSRHLGIPRALGSFTTSPRLGRPKMRLFELC